MTASKLPEWPEDVVPTIREVRPWDLQERRAALARMEALVEVVNDLIDETGRPAAALMARINELLAACERGEG